ncbi:MAG: GNAT family N-acetyltransferase [Roseburia sp.]|nr:GNAT family N-acetyltransferase [Roseburia sp.]
MKKENVYITGDLVVIKSVTENDIDDYLHVRRYATVFKLAYDAENALWGSIKQKLIDDVKGDDIICLIYQRKSKSVVGYIEIEMDDVHHPDIGIGILEEEREKGYAFEAANLLISKVLENGEIEYIEWMTTRGNEASNRIARKLGGRIIREEPIIPKEALEHWDDENSEETEIPCYVVYGIYRK